MGNHRGGRTRICRPYRAGELYSLIIFDVTFINLDKDLSDIVILYPDALLSAITCHDNIMKIKLTHNIHFCLQTNQEVRCLGGDGGITED